MIIRRNGIRRNGIRRIGVRRNGYYHIISYHIFISFKYKYIKQPLNEEMLRRPERPENKHPLCKGLSCNKS